MPPVAAAYQLIVPCVAVAPNVTVPAPMPQREPLVTVATTGAALITTSS